MTAQEVRPLPTEEKFQIMETIWEDLRERFEASEISPQLRDLLRERRARVAKGEARLLDWAVVDLRRDPDWIRKKLAEI